MLPLCLFDVLQTGFMCLAVFVLVAAAVPFILPVFVLLLIIFYYFRYESRVGCGSQGARWTRAGLVNVLCL